MIVVQLRDGIGNQLFQYAFARSIHANHNVNVALDTSTGFKDAFYKRAYTLHYFNISLPVVSQKERYGFIIKAMFQKLIRKFHGPAILTRERNLNYNDFRDFDFSKNTKFMGYWQTEKYFKSIESVLRRELTLKCPLHGNNLEVATRINETHSVSIHVRAMHGVSVDGTVSVEDQRMFGQVPLNYYRNAISYLYKKLGDDLSFYVFSDNLESARKIMEKLNIDVIYVTHNTFREDYEDLRLMSLCRHNIIARSTFSWWGAWLNSNPNKIVVAPKQWFHASKLNTSDIIPENWIQM